MSRDAGHRPALQRFSGGALAGKPSDPWAQVGIFTGLGFVLFGGIAGGYLLGGLLDSWLGTRPIFAMLIAAAGFAGALIEILRILDRIEKRASGNDSNSGPRAG